jgi:hypothetical protein
MNTNKKFGGTIKNWTLNKLSVTPEQLKVERPDVKINEALILSGYVVEDPLGRWQPGWHMKSSLVVDIDRENGTIETSNTIYHVEGEEDTEANMGDLITKVFY